MFVCKGCNKKKTEKERRFVGNDWCSKCCDDELERTKPAGNGLIRSELPAYMRPPKR